jgi:hypothetical protein
MRKLLGTLIGVLFIGAGGASSREPLPVLATAVNGVGFPYIVPSLRAECSAGVCVIRQTTEDLSFDLTIPNGMAFDNSGCEGAAPGEGYEMMASDRVHSASSDRAIVIDLVGKAQCKSLNISMKIASRMTVPTDIQREEAFQMARSWFICVLRGRRQLICADKNPLDTPRLLGELRARIEELKDE